MLVAFRRPGAHDRRALLLEASGELVHGVAVVIRVPGLVAHTEDRHLARRPLALMYSFRLLITPYTLQKHKSNFA